MSFYIEIPTISEYAYHKGPWHKNIPLFAGIYASWDKYDFSICDCRGHFPRGRKEGTQRFRFGVGLLGYSIYFHWYEPKKIA